MTASHLVVYCTCPDQATAEALAGELVTARLAACVNIGPVTSVYSWQGQREQDAEVLLIIKTRQDRFPALEQRIRERHPYEVPEIIALPIVAGGADYLRWIDDNVGENP